MICKGITHHLAVYKFKGDFLKNILLRKGVMACLFSLYLSIFYILLLQPAVNSKQIHSNLSWHSTSFDFHVCLKLTQLTQSHTNYNCLEMYTLSPMLLFFFSVGWKRLFLQFRVPFLITSWYSPLLSVSLSPLSSVLFLWLSLPLVC